MNGKQSAEELLAAIHPTQVSEELKSRVLTKARASYCNRPSVTITDRLFHSHKLWLAWSMTTVALVFANLGVLLYPKPPVDLAETKQYSSPWSWVDNLDTLRQKTRLARCQGDLELLEQILSDKLGRSNYSTSHKQPLKKGA